MFSRPHDLVNYISQSLFLGSPVCHSKVLLVSPNKDYYLVDYTWNGLIVKCIDPSDFELTKVTKYVTHVVQSEIHPSSLPGIEQRVKSILGNKLRFSNWLAVDALLHGGSFASFTCSSALYYIIYSITFAQVDTPAGLLHLLYGDN